ncbi:MAG: type II toxin-antitoxin system HicB family antitoxin [Aestuariivirga sp.]|uniref:type II toxin-antitoxin system HicB family antitoxin n=1 Tax=Aestuariivirga sp. TaxID=2650926 RepID=UPI0038D0075E
MTTMTCNGYQATIEFDGESELFHGEVTGLRDVITFQGKSVAELKKAFRDSVEDYLAFCKERGEEPEKPFSGQFVVRTGPQAHRAAVLAARAKGMSLNAFVTTAIETASGAANLKRAARMGTKSMKRAGKG